MPRRSLYKKCVFRLESDPKISLFRFLVQTLDLLSSRMERALAPAKSIAAMRIAFGWVGLSRPPLINSKAQQYQSITKTASAHDRQRIRASAGLFETGNRQGFGSAAPRLFRRPLRHRYGTHVQTTNRTRWLPRSPSWRGLKA